MSHIFDLKLFLKFLARNKTFTYINLFGFSIALMFVIFIAAYSIGEMKVDKFHEKGDQIYLMADRYDNTFPTEIKELLDNNFPQIEAVCRVSGASSNQQTKIKDRSYTTDLQFVDSVFFDLFTFELLAGDKENVLKQGSAVISRSFAEKAFPDRKAVGELIILEDSLCFEVSGIMEDITHSTIEYADIILRMEELFHLLPDFEEHKGVKNFTYDVPTFLYLRPGVDTDLLEEQLLALLTENLWQYQQDFKEDLRLINLKEVYLYKYMIFKRGLNQGSWVFMVMLICAGSFILSFGTINYTNLSLAQSVSRAKEVAIRRFLSASRVNIYTRLVLEAVLFCFICFLLALGLAFLFLPEARFLLGVDFSLNVMFSPVIFSITLLVILFIGTDAGNIPALIFSRTKVNDILKGEFRFKTKIKYSKYFLIFQYFLTIFFVGISLTMYLQIRHMVNTPLGYKTENIMDVRVHSANDEKVYELAERLKQESFVKQVALSGTKSPLDEGLKGFNENKGRSIYIFFGDENYMDLFGFKPVYELSPEKKEQAYMTAFGMSELELSRDTLPEMKAPFGDARFTGIIEDFHVGSFHKRPTIAMVQILDPELFPMGVTNLFVETSDKSDAIKEKIASIYEEVLEIDYMGYWMSDLVIMTFFTSYKMFRIITVFSAVALLLAFLGLLALSSHYIEIRKKEIAIRKVFGSTNQGIFKKLIFQFVLYVGIGFLLAIAPIYIIMDQWLGMYIYRISMTPWIFLAAGGLCFCIAVATVYWQCREASTRNPVDSLKSE